MLVKMAPSWFVIFCVLWTLIEIGNSAPLMRTETNLHTGSRSRRGFGYKNKSETTTTVRPVWKPRVNGRIALAKQKNIDPSNIPENDEEFKNVWPDDYYDDYDFEHKRNMIQHGTFEGKIQKYHQQELEEAQAETTAQKGPAAVPKPQTDNDQM